MKPYQLTKASVKRFEALSTAELCTKIYQRIAAIHPNDDIAKKLIANIESIKQWSPGKPEQFNEQNRYHVVAKQSLVNALIIMDVIAYFKDHNKEKDINEVFKGGHVVIDDNGELVNSLNKALSTFARFSSHYKKEKKAFYKQAAEISGIDLDEAQLEAMFNSSTPDHSIRAQFIFHEAVFGIFTKKGRQYSWFQLEAHSHQAVDTYGNKCIDFIDSIFKAASYSLEKLQHHTDYVKYRFFYQKRKNIGPYGNSPMNDAHPIFLSDLYS